MRKFANFPPPESNADQDDRERRTRKEKRRQQEEECTGAPSWACAYCGISEKNAVVQCNDCKRWFCNGRGSTSGGCVGNFELPPKLQAH